MKSLNKVEHIPVRCLLKLKEVCNRYSFDLEDVRTFILAVELAFLTPNKVVQASMYRRDEEVDVTFYLITNIGGQLCVGASEHHSMYATVINEAFT